MMDKNEVMVFGGGDCARRIAANLDDQGIHAHLTAADELTRCRGYAGNFLIELNRNDQRLAKTVPTIVVAEEDRSTPNYAAYGLETGSRVMTISDLEVKLTESTAKEQWGAHAKIVFLCGLQKDSHPSVARRMMDSCFRLQTEFSVQTWFMTGNLKVSLAGSEERVHEAKRSGTVFLKFTHDYPTIKAQADSGFLIVYPDELTRTLFELKADWLIVDETIEPGLSLAGLAEKLGIRRDASGFAQDDNVRRISHLTNQRGIYVAGGSRAILSETEKMADADQVSLNVLAFLKNPAVESLLEVSINQGRCARCLTCYRYCPHKAIDIGDHISVVAEACQQCGICVAGCPNQAIIMTGMQVGAEANRKLQKAASGDTVEKPARIIVFGCARSAGQSQATNRQQGRALPEGVRFVEVPCGGSVSSGHLLDAFNEGADGVMLCTCHTGNCQAETGNQVALRRTKAARELLESAGVDKTRLHICTVAANMNSELAFMIEAFTKSIILLNNPPKENQNG